MSKETEQAMKDREGKNIFAELNNTDDAFAQLALLWLGLSVILNVGIFSAVGVFVQSMIVQHAPHVSRAQVTITFIESAFWYAALSVCVQYILLVVYTRLANGINESREVDY